MALGTPLPLLLSTVGDYEIDRSLRFNSSDSPRLDRTPSSDGNRKTWTKSFWIKRGTIDRRMLFGVYTSGSDVAVIELGSSNNLHFYDYNSGYRLHLVTTQVFRDPSAWYHIVIALDTTQSTSSNRVKIYVNGEQVTSFSTETYPSQDLDGKFNTGSLLESIGTEGTNHRLNLDGYLAEVNFIDGSALTPSSFGETKIDTGQWVPKKYAGSYGSQGWYLDFSDNSGVTATTLGKDSSGNGNNWTPANLSVTAGTGNDSLEDTPTNNFPTLNPINNPVNSTLAEGNLRMSGTDNFAATTFLLPKSGKWYVECSKYGDTKTQSVSVTRAGTAMTNYNGYLGLADNVEYVSNGELGNRTRGDTSDATAWSSDADALIGIAVDMDNGAVYFAHDNTWQNSGNPTSGASKTGAVATDLLTDNNGEHFIAVHGYNAGSTYGMYVNFGQRAFTYSPPTGYEKLCTANLPDPTIEKPTDYFNTVLYTGNGSTNAITGVGFQPDLVWIKERNASENHCFYDSLRGVTKRYIPNSTADQATVSDGLTAFGTDGFTLGANDESNTSGQLYVAFCWKGGSSAVANTTGSINTSVRANTTTGFSNLSYTGNATAGATIGHSLGAVPQWMIIKRTSDNWIVYHHKSSSSPEDDYYEWQGAGGKATSGAFMWNNTLPTSTVATLYSDGAVNASGDTIYWWGWTGINGLSKFGNYTGNGSADGPFVHTGFKPAWVMVKGGGHWLVWHDKVPGYNVNTTALLSNAPNAEEALTAWGIDFLANGFKVRGDGANRNQSGVNFIYMAFASSPFKYSTGG